MWRKLGFLYGCVELQNLINEFYSRQIWEISPLQMHEMRVYEKRRAICGYKNDVESVMDVQGLHIHRHRYLHGRRRKEDRSIMDGLIEK